MGVHAELSLQWRAAAEGKDFKYAAALERFAGSRPSPIKLIGKLALTYRSWNIDSRLPALARIARSAELAAGSSHFLEQAYAWFAPTEPQATHAFVKLLNAGDRATRLARGQALWDAAARASRLEQGAVDPALLRTLLDEPPVIKDQPRTGERKRDNIEVKASVADQPNTDDRKRIDIKMEGSVGGQPVRLIIEAKYGHDLTVGQLSAYADDCRSIPAERLQLLVLCPRLRAGDARLILEENRKAGGTAREGVIWRFATWRNFMIDYSCALPREYDDSEFRRLRRSLAENATGWE